MREDTHERERHLGEARERERDIIGGGARDPRECDEKEKRNWGKNKQTRISIAGLLGWAEEAGFR